MSSSKSEKFVLDEVIINEVGQFGKYQIRIFSACAFLILFVAMTNSEYVFTAAKTKNRCFITECDDDVSELYPFWVQNAIPGNSSTAIESCIRFGNNTNGEYNNQTCPSSLFDETITQGCDRNIYEDSKSVVKDFDLGCKEWLRSFIGTARVIGLFIALLIIGYASDTWGRRICISVFCFNIAWPGIIRYWVTSYWGFVALQFLEAMLSGGSYTCSYVLLMEIVGPKYRQAVGATSNTIASMGSIFLSLLAWGLPDWRTLTLCLHIPPILLIGLYWVLPESIRWLLSKGRYSEAAEMLKHAAEVNGNHLSNETITALQNYKNVEDTDKNKMKEETESLLVLIWKHKIMLWRCIIMPIMWLSMTLAYYGLSLNAVDLAGSKYTNYIVVSAIDIPGYWLAVSLDTKIGRKKLILYSFWICGGCMIAYVAMSGDIYWLSFSVYLLGKLSISTVIASLYVYTSEVFPTKYRSTLFSYCSMVGRIGHILAPLTPSLGTVFWSDLPFAIFAGCCVLCGVLINFCPETRGIKLPDTMEEASQMGR